MSRLKSKLERRLKKSDSTMEQSPERSDTPPSEPTSKLLDDLRKRMEKTSARSAPSRTAAPRAAGRLPAQAQALSGEVVEAPSGPVLVNTRTYAPSYRSGQVVAADFLETGDGLRALAVDKTLKDFSPIKSLFVDTETTGLAGGTGTLPFLTGVGWFDPDGRFTVKQLFCREPSEERAMLEILVAHMSWAENLVTFNGRAFDIPLLNTRFVLHRMKNPGYALPHLDLLHIARRVFKRRLKDRSLTNLESAILGFERVGDIPGSAIPGVYAAYLRGGTAEPLQTVLEHNALDLISLAALGATLEHMYRDPAQVAHAADHLGLAKAALASGQRQKADQHLTRAGQADDDQQSRDAMAMLAEDARRRGEYQEAKRHWKKALERCPEDPHLHLCLAKHYEHKEKNFEKALEHAVHTAAAEGEEGREKRTKRLNRRKARHGSNDLSAK